LIFVYSNLAGKSGEKKRELFNGGFDLLTGKFLNFSYYKKERPVQQPAFSQST
jgi:hypothetical protein